MADQIQRFEIFVLRPLWALFLGSAIVFLSKGMWLWLAGCALSLFYLGIVGSKLHPYQSASDLAKGPLKTKIESEFVPPQVKAVIVGQACTRVGILVGFTAGAISWGALSWPWYFILPAIWIIMLFTGALMKLAFKEEM